MVLREFSRDSFDGLGETARDQRCRALADVLGARFQAASGEREFHVAVGRAVDELRALGHDPWSFDELEDSEIWGPDYSRPRKSGIIVTFRNGGPLSVEWSPSTRNDV